MTERKQAEQERERLLVEIARRSAELDATIDSAADGLIIYANTGEILRTNPAADRLLYFTARERDESVAERWLARHARSLDGKPLSLEEIPAQRALRGEVVHGLTAVFPRQEGDLWLSRERRPHSPGERHHSRVVATYTDITPFHELQEQQRLFVHTISHDLRTPLTIIQGHVQILLDDLKSNSVNSGTLMSAEAILRVSKRMNVMIQDMVDAARAEGGQLELKCEVVMLFKYLADLLERSKMVLDVNRIRVEVPTELPPVSADYDRLDASS